MEAMVLPNPSLRVATMVVGGKVVKARKRETRKRAMKALSLYLEVSTMIPMILMPTSAEVCRVLIDDYLVT
jgi:hypothetical protein